MEENMKKILILLLTMAMCFGFAGCGSDDEGESMGEAVENGAQELEDDAKEGAEKIERTVDAAAAELGLTGPADAAYEDMGADQGKSFNGGSVEIYYFDEDSQEYKAIENGEGNISAAAVNDGFVIVTEDKELAERFKKIEFK